MNTFRDTLDLINSTPKNSKILIGTNTPPCLSIYSHKIHKLKGNPSLKYNKNYYFIKSCFQSNKWDNDFYYNHKSQLVKKGYVQSPWDPQFNGYKSVMYEVKK